MLIENEKANPALVALSAFREDLENPEFRAGEWASFTKSEQGYFQMPYVVLGTTAKRFIDAAYENGWVMADFDWSEWAQTSRAVQLRDDHESMVTATASELFRMLTVCIRQDRFSEGALLEAFNSGLIKRIVQRAAILCAELPSTT